MVGGHKEKNEELRGRRRKGERNERGKKEDQTRARPDTRHKMRLVNVLFTFEDNVGRTDGRTDPLIEMRRRI